MTGKHLPTWPWWNLFSVESWKTIEKLNNRWQGRPGQDGPCLLFQFWRKKNIYGVILSLFFDVYPLTEKHLATWPITMLEYVQWWFSVFNSRYLLRFQSIFYLKESFVIFSRYFISMYALEFSVYICIYIYIYYIILFAGKIWPHDLDFQSSVHMLSKKVIIFNDFCHKGRRGLECQTFEKFLHLESLPDCQNAFCT